MVLSSDGDGYLRDTEGYRAASGDNLEVVVRRFVVSGILRGFHEGVLKKIKNPKPFGDAGEGISWSMGAGTFFFTVERKFVRGVLGQH